MTSHTGLRLFTRIRQPGDTPGLTLTVKQVIHTVFIEVIDDKQVAERRWCSAKPDEMFAQRTYHQPMYRRQLHAVMPGNRSCQAFAPLLRASKETRGVKERSRTIQGITRVLGFTSMPTIEAGSQMLGTLNR